MAADPLYVASRRALLDALEAFGGQRRSVVLIGAQAVYLHAPDDDLAVAPTTTDADLGLDPDLLSDSPLLGEMLRAADFELTKEPGIWRSRWGTTVDLIVPESLAGTAGAGPASVRTATGRAQGAGHRGLPGRQRRDRDRRSR